MSHYLLGVFIGADIILACACCYMTGFLAGHKAFAKSVSAVLDELRNNLEAKAKKLKEERE